MHAYPLVTIAASSLPLPDAWRFAVDPSAIGQAATWFTPTFDDSRWTAVVVPHTWNVMPDYVDYTGLAWYRRRFIPPATAQDAYLRLRFEAVFYLAHVWLNGTYLGAHEGGYTPFEFDVSGLINPGVDNIIAVQVDNRRAMNRLPANVQSDWSFDWWNYGGIVRDVALHLSSRAFIAQQQIVAVPHLSAAHHAERASVTATVQLRNTSATRVDGMLLADVLDEVTGLSVLSTQPVLAVTLRPDDCTEAHLCATISQPKLWHFDHPHLYRWVTSLHTEDGQVLHTEKVTFGVRTIVAQNAQLYLNGEPLRVVGITRHADSPGHGLAETITVMAEDYADLKTLNTVLSRPAHYPQAEFILDYADRAGILLIPEVPAWQLTAEQMDDPHMRELERQHLREMIVAQSHHPSVWAWSLGNEFASQTAAGHAFVRDMMAYVKALDPTRPVGFASNLLNRRPQTDATALADFVMMNQYFGTWGGPRDRLGPALDAIHATWPDKPVVVSEYGFEPRWEKLLKWPLLKRSQYYRLSDDESGDAEADDIVRRRLISEQLAVLRTKPFVVGAIFWTYQDYSTPTHYQMGLVDAQRRRRGSWTVIRDEYAPLSIAAVTLSSATADLQEAEVALRIRGPIHSDLPVYSLHQYQLHWLVMDVEKHILLDHGDLALPTLGPGARWSTRIAWPMPTVDYVLTLRIIRPTGFTVLECCYDAQGNRQAGVVMPV